MKSRFASAFPSLSASPLQHELLAHAKPLSFEQETQLLSPGAEVSGIPLLISGHVRVLREDESGREILLYYIKPGESCIMSILAIRQHSPSQVLAFAAAGTELLLVPARYLSLLARSYPAWNAFVQDVYQTRFEELISVINELAFSRVDARLLDLLTTRGNLSKSPVLSITHQQLADELGTAREVVSRLLKKLEQQGQVKLGRGKIELL
ncbi:MAG: Crp/Fnr family transcriptional regulator [Candidatus Melainabacteria bacterium HGW-Melainabacteria-1]|nr:MAG: Crp/Fnr family transcriptional regulator [Candidatus Melainabacteria bacterium HGW-Melainabacteria-1]